MRALAGLPALRKVNLSKCTQLASTEGLESLDALQGLYLNWCSKLTDVNGLRSLTAALNDTKDPSVAALGATNKMFWSEMHQRAMELALDIHGPTSMLITAGPDAGSWPGAMRDKRRPGYPVSPMMSAFFFSRSETSWGGTSQIQRNIVGERVLGLPKEPKPA